MTTHTPHQAVADKTARLIAAAPQMYELLTQVRNYTHEPLPEELQKEIAHVLYTINTASKWPSTLDPTRTTPTLSI